MNKKDKKMNNTNNNMYINELNKRNKSKSMAWKLKVKKKGNITVTMTSPSTQTESEEVKTTKVTTGDTRLLL